MLGGSLDWNLIGTGALIGAVVVTIDELLKRSGKGSLPPLAVGMGMYLPMDVTALVVVGAVLGHFYNRWAARQANPEFAERMGVLTATGLIVGDGLFNVAYALTVWGTDNADVLAVVQENALAVPLGLALFGALVALAYGWMRRAAARPVDAAG